MMLTLIQGGNEPQPDHDYTGIFRDENGSQPCSRSCRWCGPSEHCWSTECAGYADSEPDHPGARAGLVMWLECRHCSAWRAAVDADFDDGESI